MEVAIPAGVGIDLDLRVVDAGEVAGAGRLVLLGLEREGVRVHTGAGATGVMVVGLDLVEVLTLLLLETVLAVEDELEGVEGTTGLLSEAGVTTMPAGPTARRGAPDAAGERRQLECSMESGLDSRMTLVIGRALEKFQSEFGGRGVGEAPHELLNWVVVGEADLLGLAEVTVSVPVCWTCSMRYS